MDEKHFFNTKTMSDAHGEGEVFKVLSFRFSETDIGY
jgi:hypothetical protein